MFRLFVFEVHVEKERLMDSLELPEAIAGVLHLAFVFDLKYPKVIFCYFFPLSNNCILGVPDTWRYPTKALCKVWRFDRSVTKIERKNSAKFKI